MPAQELPKVLRNLMDTLLEGNQLYSWNIFEERNGQIVVKIKFSDGHIAQPQQASYKRKTSNQVKRDETRLAKHRDRVTTAAPKPACLSTHVQENRILPCDIPRPLSPGLRRSQRHKPVEDTSIEQTRAEEADDECQMNVSTVSMDSSRVHDSSLYVKLTSLSPEASVFTPAVHNPYYSTPVMENPCLQRSVGSSDESETGSVHMDNSQEDVCPSDLTTCIDDTDTHTEPTVSETFYKMEEPPPPPPALMMLLQNIMDTTSTVREQTKLPL